MNKKVFLLFLIVFFLNTTKVFADYACGNEYTCLESNGGGGVFYDGCAIKNTATGGYYCAGTGTVAPENCSCSNTATGATSDPNDCLCDLNYNRTDGDGPSCKMTSPSSPTACYCLNSGAPCPSGSNSECRSFSDGAYPADLCGCSSGGETCSVNEVTHYVGCCYYTGPEDPTDPDPTATATTTPTITDRNLTVTGNLYLDDAPAFSANNCTGDTTSFASRVDINLYHNGSTYSTSTTSGNYSILVPNVTAGENFTISAHTTDANYECSCPSDGEVTCSYYDLTVPAVGTNSVSRDIYFDNINYPESWYQSFGAGSFAQNEITSIVPTNTCFTPNCQAAMFVPQSALASVLSSGFPVLANTSANISTNSDPNDPFANIHLSSQRAGTANQDSFATGFGGSSIGYDYFYQLAVDSGKTIREVDVADVDLDAWRSNTWISGNGTTDYFVITGGSFTMTEGRSFDVADGESIVIFIDNDLFFQDNDWDGFGDKITIVAQKTATNPGGFLAFFATGNIRFRSSVGEILDVADPTNIPEVNYANANVEGVFISDSQIIINGYQNDAQVGGYPDLKFIGAGTFVGNSGIALNRQADDPSDATDDDNRILNSLQALENFIYRPDLLINWPTELRSSIVNWREVAPQSFNVEN